MMGCRNPCNFFPELAVRGFYSGGCLLGIGGCAHYLLIYFSSSETKPYECTRALGVCGGLEQLHFLSLYFSGSGLLSPETHTTTRVFIVLYVKAEQERTAG